MSPTKTSVSTTTFAQAYSVDPSALAQLGCFNPTLAIDTNLAIDPLLLKKSSQPEFSGLAHDAFEKRFKDLAALLDASTQKGDLAWRNAQRLFIFPEISGTGLGLGKRSSQGHGIGPRLQGMLLQTASEMVSLGVRDPALLPLLALMEKDVGMDLISDMTTNITIDALVAYTQRVCSTLKIPLKPHRVLPNSSVFELPSNPLNPSSPIILVAVDVLRDIPIAMDFDGIQHCTNANDQLRQEVNSHIANLLGQGLNKAAIRRQALASRKALETLVEAVGQTAAVSSSTAPFAWAELAVEFANKFPLNSSALNVAQPTEVVQSIVDQFKHLVEHEGLNKSLWNGPGKPRHEHEAQRLFYAIAQSYCKANNLDVTPEADHGRGPMDFKFSKGFNQRIVVELKLSTNSKVVDGYSKQLKIYVDSSSTDEGLYLVLDLGTGGTWQTRLTKVRNDQLTKGKASKLEFVDATLKASASKN